MLQTDRNQYLITRTVVTARQVYIVHVCICMYMYMYVLFVVFGEIIAVLRRNQYNGVVFSVISY